MDQRVAVVGARRGMKTLQPTQKTGEACRRLGLTLPPLQVRTQQFSNKSSNKKTSAKQQRQARPTVIFGHSLSDYVTKPSYFCHPVVVPALTTAAETQDTAAKKAPRPTPAEESSHSLPTDMIASQPRSTTVRERRVTAAKSPRRTSRVQSIEKQQASRRASQKFLEFCNAQGFNPSSSEFVKISHSFRNVKKFGPISKATTLVPLTEDCLVTATRRNASNATLRLRRNETIQRMKQKHASGRRIREDARQSAAKGQDAAAKAITFILSESRQSPAKTMVLPPIKSVNALVSSEGSMKADLLTEAPR